MFELLMMLERDSTKKRSFLSIRILLNKDQILIEAVQPNLQRHYHGAANSENKVGNFGFRILSSSKKV